MMRARSTQAEVSICGSFSMTMCQLIRTILASQRMPSSGGNLHLPILHQPHQQLRGSGNAVPAPRSSAGSQSSSLQFHMYDPHMNDTRTVHCSTEDATLMAYWEARYPSTWHSVVTKLVRLVHLKEWQHTFCRLTYHDFQQFLLAAITWHNGVIGALELPVLSKLPQSVSLLANFLC
jgi:hypothetical protein